MFYRLIRIYDFFILHILKPLYFSVLQNGLKNLNSVPSFNFDNSSQFLINLKSLWVWNKGQSNAEDVGLCLILWKLKRNTIFLIKISEAFFPLNKRKFTFWNKIFLAPVNIFILFLKWSESRRSLQWWFGKKRTEDSDLIIFL